MFIQQPIGATNLQTLPRLSGVTRDPDGLIYYGAEIGSLKAGETFDLTVGYQKDSDPLTYENLPIQSSAPITSNTPGRVSLVTIIPWGVGGGAIIALGIYGYWVLGRKRASPSSRGRRVQVAKESEITQKDVYCHHCGKRAAVGDRFCRCCSTRLYSSYG